MKLVLVRQSLYVPELFLQQEGIERAVTAAVRWLEQADAALLDTPWVIGSFRTDILGNPRDSQSHSQGLAVDISPTVSHESLVDPTVMPGLAWNVADLAVIAHSTYRDSFWCVEGDHIHMLLTTTDFSLPPNQVWAFPSIASTYDYASFLKDTVAGQLLGQPYLWDSSKASLLGPNQLMEEGASVGDTFYKACNPSNTPTASMPGILNNAVPVELPLFPSDKQ